MRQAPAGSALARAVHGEQARWDVNAHLLALAVDVLQHANWQRGGGKGSRPKPVARPQTATKHRATVMSIDDLDRRLGYSPRA